jgi:hypothetical protein
MGRGQSEAQSFRVDAKCDLKIAEVAIGWRWEDSGSRCPPGVRMLRGLAPTTGGRTGAVLRELRPLSIHVHVHMGLLPITDPVVIRGRWRLDGSLCAFERRRRTPTREGIHDLNSVGTWGDSGTEDLRLTTPVDLAVLHEASLQVSAAGFADCSEGILAPLGSGWGWGRNL